MFRTLSVFLLGAALALGPVAAPPASARPDAADVGKVVVGATALYLLGKAISDRNKARAAPATRHDDDRWDRWDDRRDDRHDRWDDRWDDRGGRHDRWDDRRGDRHRGDRAQLLPGVCLVTVPDRYGRRGDTWAAAKCLQNSGVDMRRLPRTCLANLQTRVGVRPAYRPDCLARAGFSFGRR